MSPVQGRQPELRYTIDLLREIKRQSPTANLSLIIGADCLAELPQWRSWQELPQLTKIIAVARPGFNLNSVLQRLPGTLQEAVTVVPTGESPLSSSGIRKERNLAEKTPSEVADFARELGLYC